MKKTGTINSKIDKKILVQVRNYCYTHNIKMYGFIEEALILLLEKKGRYDKTNSSTL